MKRNTTLLGGTYWFVVPVLFAILLGGCAPEGIPVVRITGKVTLNGTPVDGATVTFLPEDPLTGREAVGITDDKGEFVVLSAGATRSGALPGSYHVIVSKHIYVDAQGNPVVPSDEPIPAYLDSSAPQAPPPPMPISKSMLPGKYGNAATSGLTAEVTQRGPNSFVFELTE
jgi:hypothetical protein